MTDCMHYNKVYSTWTWNGLKELWQRDVYCQDCDKYLETEYEESFPSLI